METLLVPIHYVLCFLLIITILVQSGKGADMGAVFGGASQTVFGGRGPATFLNKSTAIIAALFFSTSIWLAHITKNKSAESVVGKAPISETAPAAVEVDKAPEATGSDTEDAEKSN